MKKIFILMVCLMAIAYTAEMIPAKISEAEMNKCVLKAEKLPEEVTRIFTGYTNFPPWLLYGRDAPWTADIQVPDVYDEDDVLTSMAEDATGRIYVCYETIYDDPPGPDVYWGWGIATSIDNGQTWDNRVYYAANLSVRYPEIAISDEGRIWIWGSLQESSYNDEVIWLRSTSGTVNDPDDMDGFFWFGAGNVDNRTYPEVVTYGDTTQLVLSTWTYDNGTETVVAWIYATDGGASGTWSLLSLLDDSEPDGMTSIGVNYDGTNYIAVHGWEEDAGGGDWNVMCMIDTLVTGTGLSGWGTGNTNPDRFPSIFCSNGYAYIAYQADVGGNNYDILYNYSTDYGETWASIVDLTNDASSETYPRLYGDDQTIGVAYIYGGGNVCFNYSLDNGIIWLGTPEIVDDNSSVNENYHAAALLYTASYWHAAWEDTRNYGTDGFEIYTSSRIMGQGDITHSPELLLFNYDWSFLGDISSEKYVLHHTENPIDPKLVDVMRMSSEDELIPIFIMLAKQMNPEYLIPRAEQMSKPDRRQFVINECQTLANDDQKALLSYLKQEEGKAKVLDIVSQWTTNTICFKATSDVIREVAQRHDVWEVVYSEPLELIGVAKADEPEYKHIDFVPEDGREICWGVAMINADDVWPDYTGAGIVVGHMDSGVNYNHDDLDDHMWDGGASYPNHGWDYSTPDNDPIDEDGHGTLTAGIVAGDGTSGSNTGVAPDAQIMALRIYPGTSTEMGQAIAFAIANGADLLSCSIGWSNPGDGIKNWSRGQSITIVAAGLVWCNAAGNGNGVGGHYAVPQDINSPADCPAPWYSPNDAFRTAVMAVGATDQSNVVCSWSSYGPTHWSTGTYTDYPYPPGLMKPDVAAPGTGLKSLRYDNDTGYDNTGVDGTSFSQPHLAGTIALMLERASGLTPRQIDSIIENHAVIDIAPAGRDNFSGAGRIDALMAVNAISPGYRAKTVWVINQPSATGILQVTGITQDENEPWIIGITPRQFNVPIDDSVAVIVSTDTTGLGYSQGSMHYDTLLVWSNSILDDNPERVPVILIMATIGIEEDEELTPRENANFLSMLPNPFRTSVQIDYTVPYAQDVHFTIYDVCGQKVKTFIDGHQEAGQFSVRWTGCDDKGRKLAAGIYFGRIEVGKHAVTNKLILIR